MLIACVCTAIGGVVFGFRVKHHVPVWIALTIFALLSVLLLWWFNELYIHNFPDGPTLAEPAFGCNELQAYKQYVELNDEELWKLREWQRILRADNCQGGILFTLALNTIIRCLTTFLLGLLTGGLSRRFARPESIACQEEKRYVLNEVLASVQPMPVEQPQSYEQIAESLEATINSRSVTPGETTVGVSPPHEQIDSALNKPSMPREEQVSFEQARTNQPNFGQGNEERVRGFVLQDIEEDIDIETRRILDHISYQFCSNGGVNRNGVFLFDLIKSLTNHSAEFRDQFVGESADGPVKIEWDTYRRIRSQTLGNESVKLVLKLTAKFTGRGIKGLLLLFIDKYEKKIAGAPHDVDKAFFSGIEHFVEKIKVAGKPDQKNLIATSTRNGIKCVLIISAVKLSFHHI